MPLKRKKERLTAARRGRGLLFVVGMAASRSRSLLFGAVLSAQWKNQGRSLPATTEPLPAEASALRFIPFALYDSSSTGRFRFSSAAALCVLRSSPDL